MNTYDLQPLSIPKGFASLDEAKLWDAPLHKIQQSLACLQLQSCLFQLQELCAFDDLKHWFIALRQDQPGISLSALVFYDNSLIDLEEILLRLVLDKTTPIPDNISLQWKKAFYDAKNIQYYFKEHPYLLFQCTLLTPHTEFHPLILPYGSSAQSIAEILGAHVAHSSIENAILRHDISSTESSGDDSRI